MLQQGAHVQLEPENTTAILYRQIGSRGGEGTVYEINRTGMVAKIYHRPLTAFNIAKLRHMVADPPADPERKNGHASIAWPDQIVNYKRKPVGFTMPFAIGVQLVKVLSSKQRREWSPDFSWQGLVLTAANIATAFENVHAKGYVIGDVKPDNILVTSEARVTLVDNDSFQVVDGRGSIFHSQVYTEGYLAPELMGCDLKTTARNNSHDLFGLGVLIFKLLLCDAHPFVGVWRSRGEPPSSDDECVRMGAYVGKKSSLMGPKPTVPRLDSLAPSIRELFTLCFDSGYASPNLRPSAKEWRMALHDLFRNLSKCHKYPKKHFYYRGVTCPWCKLLTDEGVDYFDAHNGVNGRMKAQYRSVRVPGAANPVIVIPNPGTRLQSSVIFAFAT
jgi:DNA-binding helix-hairpin-helix protein with protein kinase domain